MATLILWVCAAGLLFGARALFYRLEVDPPRWIRPYGILAGSSAGVGAGLLISTLLNPWFGLQPGTFYNLAILAICFAFLGLCTGSLGGLLYAGMTLSEQSRTEREDSEEMWLEAQAKGGGRTSRPVFSLPDSDPDSASDLADDEDEKR